nr:hypothetical protein CFP56_52478 [Quercus suber]
MEGVRIIPPALIIIHSSVLLSFTLGPSSIGNVCASALKYDLAASRLEQALQLAKIPAGKLCAVPSCFLPLHYKDMTTSQFVTGHDKCAMAWATKMETFVTDGLMIDASVDRMAYRVLSGRGAVQRQPPVVPQDCKFNSNEHHCHAFKTQIWLDYNAIEG